MIHISKIYYTEKSDSREGNHTATLDKQLFSIINQEQVIRL